MLKKRTRSHHKDQHMMNHLISDAISDSDILSQKQKTSSFLKIPGLFVGFNPRSPDADSVRSPTSPLDFRIFSGFGNPFRHHHLRSENEPQQQTKWNHGKVGLSIIDSLDDKTKEPGTVVKKNILLERQLSVKSLDFGSHVNSLEVPGNKPVSDLLFETEKTPFEPDLENEDIRARSMDSGDYESYLESRFGSTGLILENTENLMTPLESGDIPESDKKLGNISGRKPSSISVGPVSVSEIEDSEDYTRVMTHGPNPKVTHIFGDRVLECRDDEVTMFLEKTEDDGNKTLEAGGPSNALAFFAPNNFLKFCYSCNKGLDGEDIYMYRGEKAFCSFACRSHEIEKEEELEKTDNESSGISDGAPEVASRSGLFITA
ncbi:hypothetical protein CASFOL_007250 [Castilleja foliolosa]|uniref:FLZ-type domain-containing protein n=1 Tax=Castilleja foliolosa TaxID=1961234 RepID=A0ABD3E988_9LAMI